MVNNCQPTSRLKTHCDISPPNSFPTRIHITVCISTSFVHRDFSIWRRNPATNSEWLRVAVALIVVQTLVFVGDMLRLPEIWNSAAKVWPIVGLLFVSVLVVFAITEMCKWEELK